MQQEKENKNLIKSKSLSETRHNNASKTNKWHKFFSFLFIANLLTTVPIFYGVVLETNLEFLGSYRIFELLLFGGFTFVGLILFLATYILTVVNILSILFYLSYKHPSGHEKYNAYIALAILLEIYYLIYSMN